MAGAGDGKLIGLAIIWTLICFGAAITAACLSGGRNREQQESATHSVSRSSSGRPIRHSPAVTVAAEKVLYRQRRSGGLEAIPDSFEALRRLCGDAQKVIPIARVSNDEEAHAVQSLFAREVGDLIPPHRVLCCSSPLGRSAIVRQLSPQMHFESNVETAVSLEKTRMAVVFANFVDSLSELREATRQANPSRTEPYQSACSDFRACVEVFMASCATA